MESNGKSVREDGGPVSIKTGPVDFWRARHEWSARFLSVCSTREQILFLRILSPPALSHSPVGGHHEILLANCLAQSEALMQGKSETDARKELEAAGYAQKDIDQLAPHKTFCGGRPSSTILMDKLAPENLGALIALYEHKIFVQSVVWGINAFDQWGVELGKALAKDILPEIVSLGEKRIKINNHDASTNKLINVLNEIRSNAKRIS